MCKDHVLKQYFVFYWFISNWRIFILLIGIYLKIYSTTIFHTDFRVDYPKKNFVYLRHLTLLRNRNVPISHTIDRAPFNGKLSFLYFWVRTLPIYGWPIASHAEQLVRLSHFNPSGVAPFRLQTLFSLYMFIYSFYEKRRRV